MTRTPIAVLLVGAALALACGGGDPAATARLVDAAPGPPGGPQLGDSSDNVTVRANTLQGFDPQFDAPPFTLAGVTFTTSGTLSDGVVGEVAGSASTPGSDGSDRCWAVVEALTVMYGVPVNGGIPGVYPERTWYGRDIAKVKWARTGEAGTDNYTCTVRWSKVHPGEGPLAE